MNYIRIFKRVVTALISFVAILFLFRLHGLKLDELFIRSLEYFHYINIIVILIIFFSIVVIVGGIINLVFVNIEQKEERIRKEKLIKFKEEYIEKINIPDIVFKEGIYKLHVTIAHVETVKNEPAIVNEELISFTYSAIENPSLKDMINEVHQSMDVQYIIKEIRGIKKEELLYERITFEK